MFTASAIGQHRHGQQSVHFHSSESSLSSMIVASTIRNHPASNRADIIMIMVSAFTWTLSPFCDAWIRAGADARIPICPARLTSQAFCLGSFSFVLTLCVRTGLGPSGTMPGRIGGPTARPVLCDQSAYGTPSNVGNKILATGSGILLPCARTESVSVL